MMTSDSKETVIMTTSVDKIEPSVSRCESTDSCDTDQKDFHSRSIFIPEAETEKGKEVNIFNFYHHYAIFEPLSQKMKDGKPQRVFKSIACKVLLILYAIYFVAVLITPSKLENSNYWCDGDGFLIINTVFYGSLLFYFQLLKPFCKKYLCPTVEPYFLKVLKFNRMRKTRIAKSSLILGAYVAFAFVDSRKDLSRLVSLLGIVFLLSFGALFSVFPLKIRWDNVISGIGIQMVFALMILRWSPGKQLFECLGDKVTSFLSFTDAGTRFAIGDFLDTTHSYAFKILPVILYFGMLVSILYHYGVLQWVIMKLGWVLEVTIGSTSCESMAVAANIFLGQSEAPLVIRPYVAMLTNSELHTVMTGGYATVAGGILASYISFGIEASHLLSASIMSAPASLVMSKIFYPETERSRTNSENIKLLSEKRQNVFHAIMADLLANLPLIANITGVLIIILASTTFVNAVADWFCQLLDYEEGVCNVEGFLGILFSPLAWLMGAPWEDCYLIGRILGTKVFITEFVAYKDLMDLYNKGLLSPRSVVISTYALCGFSSIASMGCQLGALGCIAPSRINDIALLVFRSFVAGNFACFLTACVAGTLIHEPASRLPIINGTLIH